MVRAEGLRRAWRAWRWGRVASWRRRRKRRVRRWRAGLRWWHRARTRRRVWAGAWRLRRWHRGQQADRKKRRLRRDVVARANQVLGDDTHLRIRAEEVHQRGGLRQAARIHVHVILHARLVRLGQLHIGAGQCRGQCVQVALVGCVHMDFGSGRLKQAATRRGRELVQMNVGRRNVEQRSHSVLHVDWRLAPRDNHREGQLVIGGWDHNLASSNGRVGRLQRAANLVGERGLAQVQCRAPGCEACLEKRVRSNNRLLRLIRLDHTNRRHGMRRDGRGRRRHWRRMRWPWRAWRQRR